MRAVVSRFGSGHFQQAWYLDLVAVIFSRPLRSAMIILSPILIKRRVVILQAHRPMSIWALP
ncbi:MAG: hypothetical protein RL533_403 [Pseudomonadota bacterium]